MKTNINKQYLMLCNKPVLAHTLEVFENCEYIHEIILVIHEEDRALFQELIQKPFRNTKIIAVVNGGYDRQASVYEGLQKVSPECELILIHDGARPLITPEIIVDSLRIAARDGAACVGVPVKDTIKKADQKQRVEKTLDRSLLWAIQTPQTFQRELIFKAHENAILKGFRGTDDSVLVEEMGYPVHMVMGSYTNIKITTTEDLVFAEAVFNQNSRNL